MISRKSISLKENRLAKRRGRTGYIEGMEKENLMG